jgi:hypothetical protein
MRGMRARKCHERLEGRKQGNVARDMLRQEMQARQCCKGGNNERETIVVALSLSMRHALIFILIVINICFSSFNDIDLLHIMLVDCCMLCCRECGPIEAVWQRRPPWWSKWTACLPILPSFLSRYTHHKSAKPQVRPRTNHLSNQISPPILCG